MARTRSAAHGAPLRTIVVPTARQNENGVAAIVGGRGVFGERPRSTQNLDELSWPKISNQAWDKFRGPSSLFPGISPQTRHHRVRIPPLGPRHLEQFARSHLGDGLLVRIPVPETVLWTTWARNLPRRESARVATSRGMSSMVSWSSGCMRGMSTIVLVAVTVLATELLAAFQKFEVCPFSHTSIAGSSSL